MTDELKDPSHDEHPNRNWPETLHEDGDEKKRDGQGDERDTNGVAESVDPVLVALGIPRDPLGHWPAAKVHEITARVALTRDWPSSVTVTL
jgi:hypothetical protein